MGYDDDNYGWNGESESGWADNASAGQRSRPNRDSTPGGHGGSGQSWRNQGHWEDEPSGGGYQRDNDGWGGPSRPHTSQWNEPARSSGTYNRGGYGQSSGSSQSGYGQPSGPSRAGYEQPGSSSQGGYRQDGWGADPSSSRPLDEGYRGIGGYTEYGVYGVYGVYGGYGQPSPPSQSWQAASSQTLEQPWGPAPQWGPPSQWAPQLAGQPQDRSRRRLWITLAVIAILLLAGTAGATSAVGYFGPAGTVNRFCGTLKAQSYSSVYSMLSTQFQGQITEDDFANDAVTLDRAEGSVLNCATQSAGIGDNFHFGDSSVAFSLVIKRASAGTLTGILHLTNESGSWKINALDITLLGVSLGAIQATNSFCAALQSQAYSAAYTVLGKPQTASLKQADYSQQGQWHDQVDGPVSVCQIMSVNMGNSDALASLSVAMTRSKLGKKQDVVSLDVESGAWKINAIGTKLQGTDVGGLEVTARFCSDLSHGKYADLYGLLDAHFVGSASEAYVAEVFDGQLNDVKWTGCTFDPTTYNLSGATATLNADVNLSQVSTGRTAISSVTLKLVRYGHTWKLDDLTSNKS
jgi:hypothetical protein